MLLTYCAYLALFICIAGTLWRMARWCFAAIGPEASGSSGRQRMAAVLSALCGVVFSRKLWPLAQSFVLDVLVQRRIARRSLARWIMHMSLFYGVLLLVLVHVLDEQILSRAVSDYAATRNPFMFLRHLLGLLMAIGLTIAVLRKHRIAVLKRFKTIQDRLTLILLATILLTGIALEASQIISASIFDEMVLDYRGSDDPEEIAALKAFWADQFHVAFEAPVSRDDRTLDTGRELHLDYCAVCHSRPQSAFLAFPMAMALKPAAAVLDRVRLDIWLWYLHFLAGCIALACLPFGKLFHLFAVPVSLAVHSLGDAAGNRPGNRPTRRAMGLDACTHCGVCSRHCSVAPIMTVIDNPAILPSEKIGQVGDLARGRFTAEHKWRLAQGSDICTACGRCTDFCPSGIDLHDLWMASQADLNRLGYQPPHGWIRNQTVMQWADQAKGSSMAAARIDAATAGPRFTENADTFWACVQCTTCTNVCPVVAASEDPRRDLDMTPQQVMNLMRLQLKETALGCRMVWDCVTCYKCQEHCPQGVPVADVLYELRNAACLRLAPMAKPIP